MSHRLSIGLLLSMGVCLCAQPDFVYLSDLDWVRMTDPYYGDVNGERTPMPPIKDGRWIGPDHDGNMPDIPPIRLGGKTYEKGLGIYPGWTGHHQVFYALDGKYSRFTAKVGLDDSCRAGGEGFEWVTVDPNGDILKACYRGCGFNSKRTDGCNEEDYKVPYWPGSSDVNNSYVDMFLNEVPGKTLLQTRPACKATILLDRQIVWQKEFEQSKGRNTGVIDLDIDVGGATTLQFIFDGTGTQHHPFSEGTLIKKCPWRDYLNFGDAKLHLAEPTSSHRGSAGRPAHTIAVRPAGNSVRLSFATSAPSDVLARILDQRGRMVKALCDRPMPAGANTVLWDGADVRGVPVNPGVYYYQLRIDGSSKSGSFVLR